MIDSHTSVSGRTTAVGAEIPLRISVVTVKGEKERERELSCWNATRVVELTKLDSSGDAKLNNNTLTFTVKVPAKIELEREKRERKVLVKRNFSVRG